MTITTLAWLALLLAIDAPSDRLPVFEEEVYVVGSGPLVEPVAPGEKVTIRFGAGELDVSAADVSEMRVEVELTCPEERAKRCGTVHKRLRLEPKRTAEGLTVRLGGVRASLLRKLQVSGKIVVPRDSPLDVRAGFGDVDIAAGDRALRVKMTAGDLRITAPIEMFSEASVRTKVGDASVREGGHLVSSRRKKLIGAKADWKTGNVGATIAVQLRFGDARVYFEDVAPVASVN